MLSISVPISRPQTQSSVALNFLNEKSPCDAASRQNSLTACYFITIIRPIIIEEPLSASICWCYLCFFIDLASVAMSTIERHFFVRWRIDVQRSHVIESVAFSRVWLWQGLRLDGDFQMFHDDGLHTMRPKNLKSFVGEETPKDYPDLSSWCTAKNETFDFWS